MALVRALTRASRWDEESATFVTVSPGQAWDDRDAFVRRNLDLFEQPVEQATAEPGERRSTRRPAK